MSAPEPRAAAKALEALKTGLAHRPVNASRAAALARSFEHAAEPAPKSRTERELERLSREQAAATSGGGESGDSTRNGQKRELERLSREAEAERRARQSLEQLKRELSEAAKSLARDQAAAQQPLERASEELERAAQQREASQEARALAERVEQLRAALGKQAQASSQAGERGRPSGQRGVVRLDWNRFARASRGQPPEADGSAPPSGSGRPGDQPGSATAAGEGEPAQASSSLPPAPASEGAGAGQGGRPGAADAARLEAAHVDTRVEGAPGEGPTRSEVIREAGQRGFASRAYQKVHADYARHAESVLEHNRVPPGYRFYVRRYFQLIRPRTENTP